MMNHASAILMPNWIGDCLIALATALDKKKSGTGPVALIVPEKLTGLVSLLCDLPVIPYRRKTAGAFFGSVKATRANSFARLYLLPHSFSSALFGLCTGVPVRRGVAMECRGWMLTDRLPPAAAARTRHLSREYAEVLETPGRDPAGWTGVPLSAPPVSGDAVVLCPGAAYGPAKQWPYFAGLVNLMKDRPFVVLGDLRDREIAERIAAAAPGRVENLAGKTTLAQAAQHIAAAAAVVSNDSGLLHLAGFLGTPCVGIYGSSSSAWTRPLGSAVRIVNGSCPRSPCFERRCPQGDYRCLAAIAPETVQAHVLDLLSGTGP